MYKVSGKQLVSVALFSALLAGIIVACSQRALDRHPVSVEPTAIADPTVATDEQNNIEIYRAIAPGVVNINSTSYARDFFGFVEPQEGSGSGSIIDQDGDILTNYHVIEGAQSLQVSLPDRRSVPARLVGADPQTDLAVLQITGDSLPVGQLGYGNYQIRAAAAEAAVQVCGFRRHLAG